MVSSIVCPLFDCLLIFYFLIFYQNLEDKRKVPYLLIIGASCGGIFFLVVLVIYLIRYCHRRKIASPKRVSGVMPNECAFPNPEKYELEETKSKEDIVRYEDIGMWKNNVSYEELQISQDAARYEKLNFSNGAIYQELDIPTGGGDYQEIGISNDALRYEETGFSKKAGQK